MTSATPSAPERIETEEALEEVLTRPSEELVRFIPSVCSPLVVLGAGGKMGPTLAVQARRAAEQAGHKLEVLAVSRFSDARARRWLECRGVGTLSCDLLDRKAVNALPAARDIVYLVGLKFGTSQNPAQTWAANTVVPTLVAEHYAGARIVALSTGNVYPLSPVSRGGSVESDPLTPLGEYANAAVGRERIFEFFAQRDSTHLALLRLFYAVELRYGVLRDLADRIWSGQPVELANGSFNCIWQGDANELALRSLAVAASPPAVLNLTSPELYRVRSVAARLGELLGKPVRYAGEESDTTLAGNTAKLTQMLGKPVTSLECMLRWMAEWVKAGGRSLGKPTHFEARDGRY